MAAGQVLGPKRDKIWAKTKGRCWYCNCHLTKSGFNGKTDFCTDHFVPKKKGGTDEMSNLVPCCVSCNVSKKDLMPGDFLKYLQSKGRYCHPRVMGLLGGLKHKNSDHFSMMAKKRWENQKSGS